MPTAEEAAQQNAAYRAANNLPADSLNTQILSSQAGQQYLSQLAAQDAANEEAKRVVAFSQPRVDVQTQSAAFQAINAEYAQQQGNTIGSGGITRQSTSAPSATNPYDPNTAAGIAWDINKGGGTVGANLSAKASSEGYNTTYYQPVDQSTVPTRDLSYAASIGVLIPEKSVYYPTDQHGQVKTQIFGDTYLNPASGEMTTFTPVYDQTGKVRNIQNISGGAGAYGAQSGEITFSPQGAIVLNQDRTLNTKQSPSNYQDILSNSDKYSRGGEAYYGKIMPLDSNHLLNTVQTVTPTYGSQDWWNQTIKDRSTPDTKMDTGSFGNQIGIMMYPKGTNAANYMIEGSENYVKGTTYPSDFVLKDWGYDFNGGVDRRTVAGGYKPTEESEFSLQRIISGGTYNEKTGLIEGNVTQENKGGYWDATLQVLKNPKYIATPTEPTFGKSDGGDLQPRTGISIFDPTTILPVAKKSVEVLPPSQVTTSGRNYFGEGVVGITNWFSGVKSGVVDTASKTSGIVDRNPILKMAGVAGSVGYGTVGSEFGFGASMGTEGMLASNPVGWGIALGAGTVFAAEASGRLGLTGQTKEFSVRSLGGVVGSAAYNAGATYQKAWNTRLAEESAGSAHKGVELPVQPSSAVKLPATPSYTEIVGYSLPKEVTQTNRNVIEVGGYVKSTPTRNSDKTNYIDETGQSYPTRNPTRTPVSNAYDIGYPTSTVYPTRTPNQNPTRNPVSNPYQFPSETPVSNPTVITNTPTTTQISNPYTTPFQTTYPNPTTPGQSTPKIDIPKITLGGFNWSGGSSSASGGNRRGRGANREIIGIRSSLLEFYGDNPSQLTRRRRGRLF